MPHHLTCLTRYSSILPLRLSSSSSFRRMNFWILPETVRGQSLTNFTYLGILQLAIFPLQQLQMSSPVIVLEATSLTFITTATSSPYFSSDTATTCASRMPPIFTKYSSISLGQMFSPPLMIMSFIRPTMDRYPYSSITPKSPDFIHPSSMLLVVACSSPQQLSITDHPRIQNSPGQPGLQTYPLEFTILAQRPGKILPTVVVFLWKGSVGQVWKETGDVSVIPQQLVMSFRLRTLIILVISASEHTAPATIPVLSDEMLQWEGFCSQFLRYSMNIVGTPQSEVHLYLSAACKVFLGSKPSVTIVMDPPRTMAARVPMIMPKQWQKGTGTAILSLWVYLHLCPMTYALLRILQWERVAALGLPVVPEVNWILTGSLKSVSYRSSEEIAG